MLALCDLGVFARDPTLSVSMTYGSHSQKSPRESKISTSSNTEKKEGRTERVGEGARLPTFVRSHLLSLSFSVMSSLAIL